MPLIVSENDKREYRVITLGNELEVLLIHDANADKVRKWPFKFELPKMCHSSLVLLTVCSMCRQLMYREELQWT